MTCAGPEAEFAMRGQRTSADTADQIDLHRTAVADAFAPPRHRLSGSRQRRGQRRERRRPEADRATALLCGELPLIRGRHSRGGRPRGPLLDALRPLLAMTGRFTPHRFATRRGPRGPCLTQHCHRAWREWRPALFSRREDNRGAGPLRRRVATGEPHRVSCRSLRRNARNRFAGIARFGISRVWTQPRTPPRSSIACSRLSPIASWRSPLGACWRGRPIRSSRGRRCSRCSVHGGPAQCERTVGIRSLRRLRDLHRHPEI